MLEVAEAQEGIWLKRIKGADWHLVDELDQAIWNGDKMIYYDEVLSSIPLEQFSREWSLGRPQNAILSHTNGIKSDFAIIDISRFTQEQIGLIEEFIIQEGIVEKVVLVH